METFAVLCVTTLRDEHAQVLTEAFAIANERDPSLLLTVGDETAATELFKGSDLLVCLGSDPAAATAIRRAQELGLPVLAVAGGHADALIENGRSGFIVSEGALQLADAIRWLAHRAPVRERLRTGGLLAAEPDLRCPREPAGRQGAVGDFSQFAGFSSPAPRNRPHSGGS
jgi:glycosyltransferase involved in cell wall biosynthesis